MAKREREVIKVGDAAIVPAFMQSDSRLGISELSRFIVPPRIKLVQKSSGDNLLEKWGVGDVIVTTSPDPVLLVAMKRGDTGQPLMVEGSSTLGDSPGFDFVPLYFFPEWIVWNPIASKGTLPPIRNRTTDPSDPIAVKARNFDLREEPCPDMAGEKIRYIEHLNFVCSLVDAEEPVILTFSRGEWTFGRNLCNLIKGRKAPIFGCRFHAVLGKRTNEKGNWWGLNIENADSPWVEDAEDYERNKKLYQECAELNAESRIRVDHEDTATVEVDPAATDQVPF